MVGGLSNARRAQTSLTGCPEVPWSIGPNLMKHLNAQFRQPQKRCRRNGGSVMSNEAPSSGARPRWTHYTSRPHESNASRRAALPTACLIPVRFTITPRTGQQLRERSQAAPAVRIEPSRPAPSSLTADEVLRVIRAAAACVLRMLRIRAQRTCP